MKAIHPYPNKVKDMDFLPKEIKDVRRKRRKIY